MKDQEQTGKVDSKFKDLEMSVATPTPKSVDIIPVKVGWPSGNVFPLLDYSTLLVDRILVSKPQLTVSQDTRKALVLEPGEVKDYLSLLLKIRVADVNGSRVRKHIMKQLLIPSFFQTLLSLVGKVRIAQLGLEIVPVWADSKEKDDGTFDVPEITDQEWDFLLEVSRKLGYHMDCLNLEKAAMPIEVTGDHSLMMTALIDGYVCSMQSVDTGFKCYASSFLRMCLARETGLKVLYRIQYNDADELIRVLLSKREAFV
jgi:hypothetical protein